MSKYRIISQVNNEGYVSFTVQYKEVGGEWKTNSARSTYDDNGKWTEYGTFVDVQFFSLIQAKKYLASQRAIKKYQKSYGIKVVYEEE